MTRELIAYLIQDDGTICPMPTEDILVPLHRLTEKSAIQEQGAPTDRAAIYEFLHLLKETMLAAKSPG